MNLRDHISILCNVHSSISNKVWMSHQNQNGVTNEQKWGENLTKRIYFLHLWVDKCKFVISFYPYEPFIILK